MHHSPSFHRALLGVLFLGFAMCSARGQAPFSARPLTKHRLEAVELFATTPRQYVFVLTYPSDRKFAFPSIDALKKALSMLPVDSDLEWAPSDARRGDEPLLSSAEQMDAFKAFCKEKGIRLALIPAG